MTFRVDAIHPFHAEREHRMAREKAVSRSIQNIHELAKEMGGSVIAGYVADMCGQGIDTLFLVTELPDTEVSPAEEA